jgi:prolyl-tRNA synthetase
MIARASQLYIPTLRDDPADAEAVSHKLLVRGGFVRQVSAGLWTFLPLGWRVHRKVEQIIRDEMDAIGSQEMYAPVLTPAELWQKTGRYGIPELFKLKDRSGRDFILPLTHEETFTFHATELQSYKQLPQLWYHMQTKDRDEPRPSGGLIRVREFIMKDSYSFDLDEAGLDKSFELNREAYIRIFERCGLETFEVQAESGMMGGSGSRDFLAPAGSGGNTLVTCENGDYAADLEIAQGIPRAPDFPPPLAAPEEVETPGAATIEALARMLSVDEAATSKAMPHTKSDGTVILALVRGDDRLEEAKLLGTMGEDVRPSTEEEIRAAFGADPGSLGPVGFKGEVIADETLRSGQFVAGANRTGWHLKGVEQGRDFVARFADLRVPKEGDRCPMCGGALQFQTAIEVGHIFKLGTKYSEPLGARVLDEDGDERPLLMGSYGIGLGRIMAAAVEQRHDENGIIWPGELAPYDAHVVALPGAEEIAVEAAEMLSAAGYDVLLDDRDARAGEKFADADLIGCPIRVTAGKKSLEDGKVDFRDRLTGEERRLAVADLGKKES